MDDSYMTKDNYMKIKSILLAALALTVGACSQPQDEASPEATGHAGPAAHLTQAGIRVIAPKPAAEGQMALYHKVGADTVAFVTPMADADPAVALIGPGEHDVGLMQADCKYTVVVTVVNAQDASAELATVALSTSGITNAGLPGSDQQERRVEIRMDAGSGDNYSCNVLLRNRG